MSMPRLMRFALVGAGVAALYVILYALLRTAGFAELQANTLAFGAAIVLQYVGQARVTFGRPLPDTRQLVRFVVMVGAGFLTSSIMLGWIAPEFGWPDALVASIVAALLPVQNFILMSVWVFAGPRRNRET